MLPITLGLAIEGVGPLAQTFGIVLTPIAILIGIRAAMTKVVADEDGLVRTGPLWGRRARWEEVESLSFYRDPFSGVINFGDVRLRSGRSWRLGLMTFGRRGREKLQVVLSSLRAHHRFSSSP